MSGSVAYALQGGHRQEQSCHLALEHVQGGASLKFPYFRDRLKVLRLHAAQIRRSDQHILEPAPMAGIHMNAERSSQLSGRILFAHATPQGLCPAAMIRIFPTMTLGRRYANQSASWACAY